MKRKLFFLAALCCTVGLVKAQNVVNVSNADDLNQKLSSNTYDGYTIRLTADIESSWELNVQYTKVLDLNGHNIKFKDFSGMEIHSNANFTILGSETDSIWTEASPYRIFSYLGSKVNLKGGCLNWLDLRGTVVMDGGRITGAWDIRKSITLTINGGEINGLRVNDDADANIVINGGTFNALGYGSYPKALTFVNNNTASLTVNGGTFEGIVFHKQLMNNVRITGGTFNPYNGWVFTFDKPEYFPPTRNTYTYDGVPISYEDFIAMCGGYTETVTIVPPTEFTESAWCSYEWEGTLYETSGDYEKTFKDINGNDSLVVLHLTILDCHEGQPYVDFGLASGLKWAVTNVGANLPEEYGDYFAWGETAPKASYELNTYAHYNTATGVYTKYNDTDGKTTLDPIDDAATQNWGGKWRMPTEAEMKELIDNCDWAWTTNYNGTGVFGNIVTKGDKSIFLPAAHGYTPNRSLGVQGFYWSATISSMKSNALMLLLQNSHFITDFKRNYGYTIRAVYDPTVTPSALENIESDAKIFAINGRIFGAENAKIYDILGRDVTKDNGSLKGVFVVKFGENAQKIVVR